MSPMSPYLYMCTTHISQRHLYFLFSSNHTSWWASYDTPSMPITLHKVHQFHCKLDYSMMIFAYLLRYDYIKVRCILLVNQCYSNYLECWNLLFYHQELKEVIISHSDLIALHKNVWMQTSTLNLINNSTLVAWQSRVKESLVEDFRLLVKSIIHFH